MLDNVVQGPVTEISSSAYTHGVLERQHIQMIYSLYSFIRAICALFSASSIIFSAASIIPSSYTIVSNPTNLVGEVLNIVQHFRAFGVSAAYSHLQSARVNWRSFSCKQNSETI